jgi:hypothetical protein
MPRLCINCLLAEGPCHVHTPSLERRVSAPRTESVRSHAQDASGRLEELCEF